MSLGRKETRITLTTPVYLIRTGDTDVPDLVMTENVSTNGVRVVTNRACQAGEHHRISPFPGEYHLSARVIYCLPRHDRQFSVGLRLQYSFTQWWAGVFGQRGGAKQLETHELKCVADSV
ncbi:MAG TPA: hypothetical protein VJR23_14185 [Candidatus Acidoferrales bacterium]|nr:hypothetical protein [Candidatus Acidoferrales bacterium]